MTRNTTYQPVAVFFVLLATLVLVAAEQTGYGMLPPNHASKTPSVVAPIATSTPFLYTFNAPGVLREAGTMEMSSSPYWWLNSGGELVLQDHVGATLSGDAPFLNRSRILYAIANPIDTDNGLHPQNIFRLVTKSTWENVREEAQFLVQADNFSLSLNRNASNGLLLMSRYGDTGQTLYYAGVRVDGTAVIKKKMYGVYYTMAQTSVFPGVYTGWQDDVNLIPHREWIGLRNETVTNADGSVTVRLSIRHQGADWTQLLEATDWGQYGGSAPIVGEGYAGIRTDFMDVRFDSFRLEAM